MLDKVLSKLPTTDYRTTDPPTTYHLPTETKREKQKTEDQILNMF